jgi:glycosyltransferase involved in cell wall biosynthesis
LLVVAMPFPPDGPVGASIRTVAFCRHLADSGWAPTVLSGPFVGPRHPQSPLVPRLGATGRDRAAGLHPPGWRDWIRPLLIPDRYVTWVGRAVRDGLTWLQDNPGAVIVSEGPSHACHLVARTLKQRTGRPWLADFADPWVGNPFQPARPWPLTLIERRWERSVLQEADAITTASPACVPHLGAVSGKTVVVVENGFDSDAVAVAAGQAPDPTALTLRHLGSLYGARTLQPVVTAIASLPPGGRPCRLEQIGGDRAAAPGVAWHPAVPHGEAQALMRRTDVLVLVPGASYALPTKLYEYAVSGRPILNLGDPDGEAARWIAAKGAGVTVSPDDSAAIARHVAAWRALPAVPGTGLGPEALAEYSQRHLSGILAKALHGIAAAAG